MHMCVDEHLLWSDLGHCCFLHCHFADALQIENEFGFVGPDEQYLRHLHTLAKDNLVDDVVLFSTDPPSVIDKGSLGGSYSFA